MEYLVQFFAWLMDWCHSWCPNWWADIVIFTFFTKVLQFPVSLWCQVNSLKMVSLMPSENRIKMDHYGDGDAIGEETAALYKREHYHPLLSLVPLAINIVILMAFVKVIYGIGDRLTVPGAAKPLIACVPTADGGLAWLMPLFAGAAAWLLGYSQNIFNPLQHEQSRAQQLVTNGISICISLFLGMFVAAGVGLYWATSNVFSIVVQWCENLCIPPKKHVNYPVLRRSQAEMRKFEASLRKTVVSKEDKAREKSDYKRFFKIANKHLVFYAEGGGYYKYFQSVIEWLLANSNVTIHYVTNDPKDGVFRLAEGNPHVRAYYIGPMKIIPLMMKMDADMVVMTTPDLNTYQIKRSYVKKDVEYVYLDHGPTSVHMCYRKGAFDHFDTIMANGPFQVAEHRATEKAYSLKAKRMVESGYPLLDVLLEREEVERKGEGGDEGEERSGVRRVMIANSHQKDNIFDTCLDDLIAEILKSNVNPNTQTPPNPNTVQVVLRPHPQYVRRFPAKMQAIEERYKGRADVIMETDFSKPSTMDRADVLITDWSGIAYEYAFKTKRPVLFVDTPMKVINPEWKKIDLVPTDISFRNEVGVSVAMDDMPAAGRAVAEMLADPGRFAAKIEKLLATQFYNPGRAGAVAGSYILDALIARKKGK